MVRDPTRRAAKYNVKVDPDSVASRFDQLKDVMVEQVTERFTQLADLEAKAKAVLQGEDVPSIKIPFYLSYVRQLFKIMRTHVGATAISEAQAVKDKWVARGLDDTICKNLASQLFGLSLT